MSKNGALRGQLWDQLRDQLRDQLWGAWSNWWCWGQCEAYWSCYYRFAIDIGVRVTDEQERRLRIWERLAKATYMVFSWRGVSILVQHPTVAAFDDRRRLHRIDGPALEFADGYGVYAVHGIRLSPERGEAMAKGTLTAQQIRDERNAEVRRVLIGAYDRGNAGRWMRDVGASVIDSDIDPHGRPRRLLEVALPGDEPYVALDVLNSSAEPDGSFKPYLLRVDPQCRPMPVLGIRSKHGRPQPRTCHNAAAAIAGFYGEHYHPVIET